MFCHCGRSNLARRRVSHNSHPLLACHEKISINCDDESKHWACSDKLCFTSISGGCIENGKSCCAWTVNDLSLRKSTTMNSKSDFFSTIRIGLLHPIFNYPCRASARCIITKSHMWKLNGTTFAFALWACWNFDLIFLFVSLTFQWVLLALSANQ